MGPLVSVVLLAGASVRGRLSFNRVIGGLVTGMAIVVLIYGAEELVSEGRMSEAVFQKIGKVREEEKFPASAVDTIENSYRERALLFQDELADQLGWSHQRHHVLSVRRLRRLMIATQRRALLAMRRNELIGDDVMHKVEHELDLEEDRLKI